MRPRKSATSSGTWLARTRSKERVSVDFFTLPTATFKIRSVFLVLSHERRRAVRNLRIADVHTAPHSPGQNPYLERWIGSIRRECLDHVIILNERHLQRVLREYLVYYTESRTHFGPAKDCPEPRAIEPEERRARSALPSERFIRDIHEEREFAGRTTGDEPQERLSGRQTTEKLRQSDADGIGGRDRGATVVATTPLRRHQAGYWDGPETGQATLSMCGMAAAGFAALVPVACGHDPPPQAPPRTHTSHV